MGFRVSYIATPIQPRRLVEALGFDLGIETDALPYDEWWVGKLRSNGMTVLWSEAEEFVDDVVSDLKELSHEGRITACRMNEDGDVSASYCVFEGRERWRVSWDGGADATLDSLSMSGKPPNGFSFSLDKQTKMGLGPEQDGNLFDVPLETAASVCGFRHETDLMTRAFVRLFRISSTLEEAEAVKKISLLEKLLGR